MVIIGLFVGQLPRTGSAIGAAQVQQVEASGLPGQRHGHGRLTGGHGRAPHSAAQRIGQAQRGAGAGWAKVSVAASEAGLECNVAMAAACAARVSSKLAKLVGLPQVVVIPFSVRR